MQRWIQSFLSGAASWFRSRPKSPTDRGMLMGMYLDQTNKGRRARHRGVDSQQRQDGKFAQTRRRV